MKKIILLVLSIVLITGISCSKKSMDPPEFIDLKEIIDQEEIIDQNDPISYKYKIISYDEKYLGNFGEITNPDSVFNLNGKYGSRFDKDSIMNKTGKYGSEKSQYSPFNPSAKYPPRIYDSEGNFCGVLSINRNTNKVTEYTYNLTLILKDRQDIFN